jgi:hypothetical protein
MRVGIVGGTEKNLTRFEEVAAVEGCEVEFHDGRLAGRGSEALETLLSRCDVIVLITRINSHAAMHKTQKYCRRYPRKVLFVRRFGLHALADIARAYQDVGAAAAAARAS